jgi:hypothetical protein
MAARKAGITPGTNREEDMGVLKEDIREAEGEMAETIHEIKSRVSYGALKGRARAGMREMAVEKPRQMAGAAMRSGYGYLRQAGEKARKYPIVPLFAGIAILAPVAIVRMFRRKR